MAQGLKEGLTLKERQLAAAGQDALSKYIWVQDSANKEAWHEAGKLR